VKEKMEHVIVLRTAECFDVWCCNPGRTFLYLNYQRGIVDEISLGVVGSLKKCKTVFTRSVLDSKETHPAIEL
jgi:hypothetical protein